MKNTLQNSPGDSSTLKWLELVIYYSDDKFLNLQRIKNWEKDFFKVTIAGKGDRPNNLPEDVVWYPYKKGKSRVSVWNTLLDKAEKPWVLFLQDDERVHLSDLPTEQTSKADCWTPALVCWDEAEQQRHFYQMRLVRSDQGSIFDGKNLPDCTRVIRDNDIHLYTQPIIIESATNPVKHVNVEEELSIANQSPKLYLVEGERLFKEKKYIQAASQYRQLLKMERLLPFDRLSAVNGLASCMAEQYKWDKALLLTEQSIEAEPLQNYPYLIQFKIYELSKQWSKAFEVLRRYHENIHLYSRSNFDLAINEEQTLIKLVDFALKSGNRKAASNYFENVYALKGGNVEKSFLNRALLLAIELENFERSVALFERLYADKLPNDITEEQEEELNSLMTMFMNKEWYDYVADIYKDLYTAYPRNREYKRRLIVTLTKTNKIDQARDLVAEMVG